MSNQRQPPQLIGLRSGGVATFIASAVSAKWYASPRLS